jgi:hypothetical protein
MKCIKNYSVSFDNQDRLNKGQKLMVTEIVGDWIYELIRVITVTLGYCLLTDKQKITKKIRKSVYGDILVICP